MLNGTLFFNNNNNNKENKMNINSINQIISNEKSRELFIEIIADGKTFTIKTIQSDFDAEILKIFVEEKK